ncbi:MAG TPA: phosphatase PAP2 family protein [Bacillota bacterium]|nr:phosphatase PAP2 family protein [Bacillota bacterium]
MVVRHPHRHMSRLLLISVGLIFFLVTLSPKIGTELLRGLKEHPYLSSLIVLFGMISLSLLWTSGQQIDAVVFLFFNFKGDRPLWLDRVMLTFTQLGSGLMGIVLSLFLFFVDDHQLAYEMFLGTLILWLVVEIMKVLFCRSRPFIKLTQTRIVGRRERGRSFPSGHTSQAFFMATLLAQHFHLFFRGATLLYLVAALVAITRMYVGAHYPRDVLAGGILGSAIGTLGAIIDAYFLPIL